MPSEPQKKFSVKARAQSFGHAWVGMRILLRGEHNAWIHLTAVAAVVAAGILLDVSAGEWAVLALCMGMVLAMEAMNTAVEKLADRVTSDHDPMIKKAKDLAAAAVLITALTTTVVGLIIFIPKLF